MSVLDKVTQQPSELLSYEFDFSQWLADRGLLAAAAQVFADDGLTLNAWTLVDGKVRVWVSGGVDGETYTVTARITAQPGDLRKEEEIKVRIREYS